MNIRKLNQDGIKWFRERLDACKQDGQCHFETKDLSDEKYSSPLENIGKIESRTFSTRFDLAEYLFGQMNEKEVDKLNAGDREGMWSWIAFFYFREVCERKNGKYVPMDQYRWIFKSGNFQRYYRHLFFGPVSIYRIYRADPRKAMAVLATPPTKPGDIVEQLASRQTIITNQAVMEVASKLYIGSDNKPKRNAASTARRFVTIIGQFDLTWDLFAMNPQTLLGMLPAEFDVFK